MHGAYSSVLISEVRHEDHCLTLSPGLLSLQCILIHLHFCPPALMIALRIFCLFFSSSDAEPKSSASPNSMAPLRVKPRLSRTPEVCFKASSEPLLFPYWNMISTAFFPSFLGFWSPGFPFTMG